MSTIQPIHDGAARRWSATVLTTASALIAVVVAVLLLALAGGGDHRLATPSHIASAGRAAVSPAGDCTYVRAEHACVWLP